MFHGSIIGYNPLGSAIDEKCGREVCLIPKFECHASMGKERKPYFNDVPVFAFCSAILLMCVSTRDKVGDPNVSKTLIQLLIFPTPVGLHGNNLSIQEALNMLLENVEFREQFRFVLQKINPSKFGIVINEAYIITEFAS
jgi:hypothetical protein